MSDFFEKQPDLLEGLLAPPSALVDPALQAALRERTVRLLRRRRHLRRLAWCAALAACYLLGMLSMRWFSPTPSPAPAPQPVAKSPEKAPPAPRPVPQPEPEPKASTAVALEWQALDSTKREQERKLYQEAADHYLKENDLASAARCIGRELNAGTREDLTISPEDDWLRMAIKSARQKENIDANKGS